MARDTRRTAGQADRGRDADRPREIPSKGWKDISKRTLKEVKDDHIPLLAAGVAFYSWIALFPALVALVTIWGLVASPETVSRQVGEMTSALSPEVKELVAQPLESAVTSGRGGLTFGLIAGLLATLWSASGGTNGLIKGLNVAYDEDDERKFWKRRGLAILLTIGGILFVLVAVSLVAVLPALLGRVGLGSLAQTLVSVLRWPLLAVLMMVGLAVMYYVAPDREHPKFRWVTWGAVVATVLWLIGSGLFSLYVNNFGNYDKTYGALAGVVILNLWLFLSSFIVLLGAELNSEMEAQTRTDTTTGAPEPMGRRGAVKADRLGDAQE